MLTLEEIIERLKHRRMGVVCECTGLHPNTVRAIINGNKKPCYDTLLKINDYLTSYP